MPNSNQLVTLPPIKEKPTKHLWFIHGANASPASFNFLKSEIIKQGGVNEFSFKDISYDCQDNIEDIVDVLVNAAQNVEGDFYIIGHSLGGVISVAISQKLKLQEKPTNLRGIFTMSAPFGGVESADYLRWMYPQFNLFKNISTHNLLINGINKVGAVVPTLSLVSTSGNNPLFPNSNDGVVTVKSQRALMNASYVEVPFNHFEVLLNKQTSTNLLKLIQDTSL